MTVKPVNNKNLNKILKNKDKDDVSLRIDLADIQNGSKEEY